MIEMSTVVRMTFLRNGRVIWMNDWIGVDPSMAAASYISRGIPCSPASSIRNMNGICRHKAATATEGSASSALDNQLSGSLMT